LKTAVSDLEVEYSEEEATLYYFKYMLAAPDGAKPRRARLNTSRSHIRPETIRAIRL